MEIKYPKKVSEAEIQAEVWSRLRVLGIDARMQVKAERSRLDIVLFIARRAVALIECKSWSKSYLRKQRYHYYKKSRQYQRYSDLFGLPIFVVGCRASIEPAICFAKKCCQ